MPGPFCVSITGADDKVARQALIERSQRFPFVEWAILYFPEKEGAARNPTAAWRKSLAEARERFGLKTALHLCGREVFHAILEDRAQELFAELPYYDRVQVNINARDGHFDDKAVYAVYEALAEQHCTLILQRHPGTEDVVAQYLDDHPAGIVVNKVSVLLDASRGRGITPTEWPRPVSIHGLEVDTGYAGGLSPDNIQEVEAATRQAAFGRRYWLDMETGVRTDNVFDLAKVDAVLAAVAHAQGLAG